MRRVGGRGIRNRQGFTMIELLIAISILAVALLALISTLPTGHANVDQAGRMSRAIALAQQNFEVVKNSAFPPAAGACPAPAPAGLACTLAVSLTGTTPNRLATVTVTVNWTSAERSGSTSVINRIAE